MDITAIKNLMGRGVDDKKITNKSMEIINIL
jgi:hypothetical protein